MARANRHYIPGYVWHITHRCHKREFLLKFVRDRRRWLHWLYEAKRRFGTCVLNYAVTSNHIHLLVRDGKKGQQIWGQIFIVDNGLRKGNGSDLFSRSLGGCGVMGSTVYRVA